jgi:hypothetical protein
MGSSIADCRFPVANSLFAEQPVGIWQLAIDNLSAHALLQVVPTLFPDLITSH